MILGDIIDDVLTTLKENTTTPVYFSRSEITDYINEGQLDFNELTECLWNNASFTSSVNTRFLNLPSDCLFVKRVVIDNSTETVQYNYGELDLDSYSWEEDTFTTIPENTYQYDLTTLWFTPAFDTAGKAIKIFYLKIPTELTSDSDTPDIPKQWHDALKFYALSLCVEKEGESNTDLVKSKEWINQYIGIVNQAKKFYMQRISDRYQFRMRAIR